MTDWKYFVLGTGKRPLPNCPACEGRPREQHDYESCECLTCHGFYAATSDKSRLHEMSERYPRNPWALRTGAASGVLVLDFEGPDSDPEGLNTLDRWEQWTGWSLPPTLVAGTPSGGRHLYYTHVVGVKSRNRVLPGLDVKADGGYVVAVHGSDPVRRWLTEQLPADASPELAAWLLETRGKVSAVDRAGTYIGYDYDACIRDGAPGGLRDVFFNELMFRLRRRDAPLEEAWRLCRYHWERCDQPPHAQWYMPWEHVEGKLRNVWATVLPEPPPPDWQTGWAASLTQRAQPQLQVEKVGRVTIVKGTQP